MAGPPGLSSAQVDSLMERALQEAGRCTPSPTAYNVGALLVDPADLTVLCAGYSRELPGNTHAEEVCWHKYRPREGPAAGPPILVTTMEPCETRLSGKPSCLAAALGGRVRVVIVGTAEPDRFVPNVQSLARLAEAGVTVLRPSPALVERSREVALRL